ncbi:MULTISPECIES: cupin domain-containing protein [unclassified Rhodococcus (in: high G+C Gram-positive bacteria)]|uniref:cupin domain-containing protein n=1 Tax=unclassified Rhodococcus (in: high G+C Gram-positive bacteria) TaxID=192944 RepID=UPI00233F1CC1|nr:MULTISPECIES: hypothetical protein [unclassified Rhodococcus (in: high G+C Gram-positive bacteria)]MDC3729291.1 hypothetical protein [Rhodococcus sp. Rp3]WSE24168.1 hypothetical protein U9J23_07715 [Rhodococcus sp. PD04]
MTTQETHRAGARVCYDTSGSGWEPLPDNDGSWTVLRRSPDGAVLSALVHLAPGFERTHRMRAGELPTIGYVLDGSILLRGTQCDRGTMVALRPRGDEELTLTSSGGATMVLIRRPDHGACPGLDDHRETVLVATPEDMPVVESIVAGKKTGITRRVMWVDSTLGGDIRELTVPPGFVGAGRGHHPCGEEILCLDGAITADELHEMKQGWYLYNPAEYVHGGHEFSEHGARLLEWHDGAWDLVLDPA